MTSISDISDNRKSVHSRESSVDRVETVHVETVALRRDSDHSRHSYKSGTRSAPEKSGSFRHTPRMFSGVSMEMTHTPVTEGMVVSQRSYDIKPLKTGSGVKAKDLKFPKGTVVAGDVYKAPAHSVVYESSASEEIEELIEEIPGPITYRELDRFVYTYVDEIEHVERDVNDVVYEDYEIVEKKEKIVPVLVKKPVHVDRVVPVTHHIPVITEEIVYQDREVASGEIIEHEIAVPVKRITYKDEIIHRDVPVIVKHTIEPVVVTGDTVEEVPVRHYYCEVTPVDIHYTSPVTVGVKKHGQIVSRHQLVDIPNAHYNDLVRQLNPELDSKHQAFRIEEGLLKTLTEEASYAYPAKDIDIEGFSPFVVAHENISEEKYFSSVHSQSVHVVGEERLASIPRSSRSRVTRGSERTGTRSHWTSKAPTHKAKGCCAPCRGNVKDDTQSTVGDASTESYAYTDTYHYYSYSDCSDKDEIAVVEEAVRSHPSHARSRSKSHTNVSVHSRRASLHSKTGTQQSARNTPRSLSDATHLRTAKPGRDGCCNRKVSTISEIDTERDGSDYYSSSKDYSTTSPMTDQSRPDEVSHKSQASMPRHSLQPHGTHSQSSVRTGTIATSRRSVVPSVSVPTKKTGARGCCSANRKDDRSVVSEFAPITETESTASSSDEDSVIERSASKSRGTHNSPLQPTSHSSKRPVVRKVSDPDCLMGSSTSVHKAQHRSYSGEPSCKSNDRVYVKVKNDLIGTRGERVIAAELQNKR